MQTEKLLLPRWIIPLEGKTEVLENYGLAIEKGELPHSSRLRTSRTLKPKRSLNCPIALSCRDL